MRIIHFTDTLRSGGKERQLVELLKGLMSTPSMECELIVMSTDIHYTYLNDLNIPVWQLLRKIKKDPSVFIKLFYLLKERRPDIIHTWDTMTSVYALPAVKLLGIKLVNGLIRDAPPSLSARQWFRSKLTIPFSEVVVANSQAGLRAYAAPPKKSCSIYNGFDFKRTTKLSAPEKVRKNHNITTKYVVGMVASFSFRKDFLTYVKAAQIVLAKRQDVTFLAIGDGENLESTQKNVAGIYKNFIKFPGKQKDVESLVQVMTIGVLSSNADLHGEGISNSIMEYMAFEKPVVATDCGGNRELILDGETGYIVQNGNATQLSDRILFLLDHTDLAKKFGRAGKQRLKNMFSLERMTQKYISLYRQILK